MGEPYDRHGALGADPDRTSETLPTQACQGNSAQSNRSLLQQIVQRLRELQQEYHSIHTWLEKASQKLTLQEQEVNQQIRDAVAAMEQQRSEAASPEVPLTERLSGQPFLRIQTLSQFQVYQGDRRLGLGNNKKGQAILRYLITRPGRRASKEALIELFWPDEPPSQAAHKLHIAVSTVRRALETSLEGDIASGEIILFDDEHYSFNPDLSIELDYEQLAAHMRAGEMLEQENRTSEAVAEYEAALALYRGDLLTEDLYADWAAALRARLEEAYLTLAGRLAIHYLAQNRLAESAACCRQILNRDSFREDAYRCLMCCYSRLGQRNQAIREFHACAQILKRELGVCPTQETLALYEQIVREDPV